MVTLATNATREIEVIPLSGDSVDMRCYTPMPFPKKIYAYAVAVLDLNKIVVCGGFEADQSGYGNNPVEGITQNFKFRPTHRCYTYKSKQNYWLQSGSMNEARAKAGYGNGDGLGMFIAGGIGDYSYSLNKPNKRKLLYGLASKALVLYKMRMVLFGMD